MDYLIDVLSKFGIRIISIVLVSYSLTYEIKKSFKEPSNLVGIIVYISVSMIISYVYKRDLTENQMLWEGFAFGSVSYYLAPKIISRVPSMLNKYIAKGGKR